MKGPLVSVIVRSKDRLPWLLELLDRLLEQEGVPFEVVVIEQSGEKDQDRLRALLARAEMDPRLRVVRRPPMPPAAARNEGVRHSRGEILLFIDDDDLPVGRQWILAHAKQYEDPACLGVTGRWVLREGEGFPYACEERAYRRCMVFSPVLRLPWSYARQQRPKRGIEILGGSNASVRRSVVERVGGWHESVIEGEENGFSLRLLQAKQPHEYLLFSPEPVMLRRLCVPGGLERRTLPLAERVFRQLEYLHRVIAVYYPWRVRLLYPAYLVALIHRVAVEIVDDSLLLGRFSRYLTVAKLIVFSPLFVIYGWWRLIRGNGPRSLAAEA